MKKNKWHVLSLIAVVSLSLWKCDSDPFFTIGGKISGLDGTVVLQNNLGDDLEISKNGNFEFATAVVTHGSYKVTVKTQPTGQTCTVSKGAGTAINDVTNVKVVCSDDSMTHTIGGTVTGLTGTVTLQNNAGDDLDVSANGDFTFDTEVADGADYEVTVLSHPATKYCSVVNGTGTATADVTDVEITCVTKKNTFVTAAGNNGNLGGIAGADALCMADLNYPGSGTYKALITDGGSRHACTTGNCTGGIAENLDWVLAPNTAYVRDAVTPSGITLIAITNDAGIWLAPLNDTYRLAVGADQAARVWVGHDSAWLATANDCSNWSDGTAGSDGNHARQDAVDSEAINYSNQLCSDTNPLLCIEQ